MLNRIKNIVSSIRSKTDFLPEAGIILGTGLGGLATQIDVACSIGYGEIDGFPVATVKGHEGRLIFGTLGGKRVVVMQGRIHFYEGYTAQEISLPIRVMTLLGIDTLFVSNAAGGLNPAYAVGELMVITDHINLIPNPLIGKNLEEFGVRYPAMNEAYTPALVARADAIAARMRLGLRHGCYLGLTGPSYETRAECLFFRQVGADAVGMSTTPEVITAAHCGLRVFAVSVITNLALGDETPTTEAVEKAGAEAERKMTALFIEMLREN